MGNLPPLPKPKPLKKSEDDVPLKEMSAEIEPGDGAVTKLPPIARNPPIQPIISNNSDGALESQTKTRRKHKRSRQRVGSVQGNSDSDV